MSDFQDVFISYGRPDSKAFAIKLKARLVEEGFRVWLDLNDIPLGVDFQQYIDHSLDRSHNFLFIISPHAVNSPYCALELERAIQFHKRVIPLFHVEEIDRETWQKRHPYDTDESWEEYQASGRHSSMLNMHPVIRKINWALFQEEHNDFEQSVQDLVVQLKSETDYVHTHTRILNQALQWENSQYQTDHLLTGKDCKFAAHWLTQNNGLVSCSPSHLHGDFIAQSLKNAQNLMCQVFLSYAEEETNSATQIRRSLTQRAFTVWTSRTDIMTGEDFQSAIRRGIEQADNLIYLISPAATKSHYCQQELDFALSLNKRIIPILACPTKLEQIPTAIRDIQYIDLTDNVLDEDYLLDENQLLQVLRQDAAYHAEHKNLLVKALKWQRQEDNPSILLKNHSLNHYETWLKLAQQRECHRPISLQEEFIETSLQQSSDPTIDVFIIYDPTDIDFARKLNETLQIHGKSTWFEQESLFLEADYKTESQIGIVTAENLIFIVSHEATTSEKCSKQLEYASYSNKRVLSVQYRTFEDEFPQKDILRRQQKYPIFDFRDNAEDFLTNFGKLYRALESNPQHVHEHTRLLIRANEWEQEKQDDSLLLRGRSLKSAEDWLKQASQNAPKPTTLQHQYIQASRELPLRRIHPVSVVMLGAVTTLLIALARIVGLFEAVELLAYDHLITQRPSEQPDHRFLIVEVDRNSGVDLRQKQIDGVYSPGIGTIPDQALLKLLTTLEVHQPRLIGLDFYRDFPATLPSLQNKLRTMENLVGICKSKTEVTGKESAGGSTDSNLDGHPPIHEVPTSAYSQRIGFNDLLDDHETFMLRRHYLWKAPDPKSCNVYEALSMTLARRYLEGEKFPFIPPQLFKTTKSTPYHAPPLENSNSEDAQTETGSLENISVEIQPNSMQVGSTTVPQLRAGGHAGGLYVEPKELLGYQTLLNFRRVKGQAEAFAPSVPLQDVLEGKVSPELIRDRIVLIGITDLSDRNVDFWNTPVGEMPGVILHGQMTSQLVSAALDNRRLIWWLPLQGEVLWLFGWSVLGGFIVWGFYRPQRLLLAAGGGILLIYAAGVVVMSQFTGLLPTVPAIATLLLTGGATTYRNSKLRKV